MIKKILLTVVVLLIVGGALMIYGTYKVANEVLKEQEPMLRQYVQMTEEEQNKYILEHADEIITKAAANAKPEEKADVELVEATKNDPAVKKALVDLGRALLAVAIMHSEPIVNDINDDLKAKFQQEEDDLTNRLEKYSTALETAKEKLKAAQ